MHDDSPLALLDDVRQHTKRRRDTLVISTPAGRSVNVNVAVGARIPGDVWRMKSILYVGTVEVDELLGRAWEAEYTPGYWPLLRYAVHVESWVKPGTEFNGKDHMGM